MKTNVIPKVLIARSAWKQIVREVEYFHSLPEGSCEAAVYPAFGFRRRENSRKSPWEMIGIEDIDYFGISNIYVPERNLCAHTKRSVRFISEPDGRCPTIEAVNTWIRELSADHPAMELGNIHSHQFAKNWTRPSSVDKDRIVTRLAHLRTRHLGLALEVIICQAPDTGYGPWRACCFVLCDETASFQPLGPATIVDDEDARLHALLSGHYQSLIPGAQEWERRQRESIGGLEEFQRFDFGWTSVKIALRQDRYLFIHLPPTFPQPGTVLYQTADRIRRSWGEIRAWKSDAHGFDLELNDIVKHINTERK